MKIKLFHKQLFPTAHCVLGGRSLLVGIAWDSSVAFWTASNFASLLWSQGSSWGYLWVPLTAPLSSPCPCGRQPPRLHCDSPLARPASPGSFSPKQALKLPKAAPTPCCPFQGLSFSSYFLKGHSMQLRTRTQNKYHLSHLGILICVCIDLRQAL